MKLRPDLLSAQSPEGLEVYQLTFEGGVPSCHINCEAQIFTPDSRFFVLHTHANPHNNDQRDPLHQFLLCDLEENGCVSPLTCETGVTAPAVSPDGRYFYYCVNQCFRTPSRLLLKRQTLASGEIDTLCVLEGVIPGTRLRITNAGDRGAIRRDGLAFATQVFLGTGDENPDFGLLIFDLVTYEPRLIVSGPSWCNMHIQYCRASHPGAFEDILIQENHGCRIAPDGKELQSVSGLGCDIHVVRDDGTNFRTMPWGRDSLEQCRGHQCWRGDTTYAISSFDRMDREQACFLREAQAVPATDHLGQHTPGGSTNDLTRNIAHPVFDHFATNLTGDLLVSDGRYPDGWRLYLSKLGVPGTDAILQSTFLLNTHADCNVIPRNGMHPHPFFSPNGKMIFFNSNESGTLQAYMMRNLPELTGQ